MERSPSQRRGDPAAEQKPVRTPTPAPAPRGLYRVPVLGAVLRFILPPRSRKPSGLRRGVSWTTGVVAVLGLLMMVYPFVGQYYPGFIRIPVEKGIEWSNLLSDLESNRIQDKLAADFDDEALAAKMREGRLAEGDPLTRIQIRKIGLDSMVVEGVSLSALKAGAGHYPQTPLPGQAGNVSIAGHRTTYGRPFNRVDELRTGDKITLRTPIGIYTYELTRDPWIVSPAELSVIGQTSEPSLTLTSCHPKGSDRQRIIVRAKLVKSQPVKRSAASKARAA